MTEHDTAEDSAADTAEPRAKAPASSARRRPPGLSPSRANDFTTCPLLYRFRVIDKLPEPKNAVMVRGTLVHAVLEDIFDDPAPERTLSRAQELLTPQWHTLLDNDPQLHELFDDSAAEQAWLDSASDLLHTYFTLEDPRTLDPADRELRVSWQADHTLSLRGIVDRLDMAADGRTRVVDYKTGRSPKTQFAEQAMFQMRFYALVLWKSTGVMPSLLQLIYLGDGQVMTYEPDETDLQTTLSRLQALWQAITTATTNQDFRPRRNALCNWCSFKEICPEWGGTPPPFPEVNA